MGAAGTAGTAERLRPGEPALTSRGGGGTRRSRAPPRAPCEGGTKAAAAAPPPSWAGPGRGGLRGRKWRPPSRHLAVSGCGAAPSRRKTSSQAAV